VIAEIIPSSYDYDGKKDFRPDLRRKSGFHPTAPIGRFLTVPLNHWCSDIPGLRKFLSQCRYVSDQKQFGRKDYWQPPDAIEKTKKGDCDDFALWCWRQLMHMGYSARFVVGRASRYGEGHAWVTFEKDGRQFLLEPLNWMLGTKIPRLSIVRYTPRHSIAWDGKTVSYYVHEDKTFSVSLWTLFEIIGEWLVFWLRFWLMLPSKILLALAKRVVKGKEVAAAGQSH